MNALIFQLTILIVFLPVLTASAQGGFEVIQTFPAEEAHQAVAVDAEHFYAIASKSIGKYDKNTGEKVAGWSEDSDGPILHLDSGVIVDGKLYAAHSNYPQIPMTSSVEIWDTETLEHVGTHSFGIRFGSLTWIDRYEESWWGVFAHYEEFKQETGKDNRWTTLVRFDEQWNVLDSWIYPEEVLNRFDDKSNSGGSWGPDGNLYVSGHDRGEVYVMKLPAAGSGLDLVKTIPVDSEGQGIAWDRSDENILYTIRRSSRTVTVSRQSRLLK